MAASPRSPAPIQTSRPSAMIELGSISKSGFMKRAKWRSAFQLAELPLMAPR